VCKDLGIDPTKGLSEEAQDAARKSGSQMIKDKKPNIQTGATLNLGKQQDRALIRRRCVAEIAYWVESRLVTKWYT